MLLKWHQPFPRHTFLILNIFWGCSASCKCHIAMRPQWKFMLAFFSLGVFEWPYLSKLHRSVFFNRDFWGEPTRIMARRKWPKFFGPPKKKIGRPWFVDPKYGWRQPGIPRPSTVWMVLKPWKKIVGSQLVFCAGFLNEPSTPYVGMVKTPTVAGLGVGLPPDLGYPGAWDDSKLPLRQLVEISLWPMVT